MNEKPDRPSSLPSKITPRTLPTPAPNAHDPIDLQATRPTQNAGVLVAAYTPPVRERSVPLNTRVAESVAEIARQAAKESGLTLRQVVEAAIITRWGTDARD